LKERKQAWIHIRECCLAGDGFVCIQLRIQSSLRRLTDPICRSLLGFISKVCDILISYVGFETHKLIRLIKQGTSFLHGAQNFPCKFTADFVFAIVFADFLSLSLNNRSIASFQRFANLNVWTYIQAILNNVCLHLIGHSGLHYSDD
jgi:hypothetical protein